MAHSLTPSPSDQDQLVTLIDGIKANLGRRPKEASADAGYCSEANLAALEAAASPPISPPDGPSIPARTSEAGGGLTQAMRRKLKRAAGEAATG